MDDAAILRILVIDDERLIGRALQRALSPPDEVVFCEDAQEALDLVAAGQHFDLVLCDLAMPGMNGADVFERICSRWPALRPRFVLMTGGATNPVTQRFLDEALTPLLSKPIDFVVLRALLEQIRLGHDPAPPPVTGGG